MTAGRRPVRIASSFFDDLDSQLPRDRGPSGEPSVHDFQVHELLRIVDHVAEHWDDLAELIPGRGDYRVLISAGILVPIFTVIAQMASDGAVEVVRVVIDFDVDWA